MKTTIKNLLNSPSLGETYLVSGWAKTFRQQGDITFIGLNDGSSHSNLQLVINGDLPEGCGRGVSLSAFGELVESKGRGQDVELAVDELKLYGLIENADKYPLAKGHMTLEHLRRYGHLRCRTNTISSVTRIRHTCAKATHDFFHELGYQYIHTPLITSSDCEGAGETFEVTTDYKEEFFGKPAYLTVSGQLNLESYCCGMGNVYAFGPAFRAEKSHTNRHLAELWMVEPEIAFVDDVGEIMEVAEQYLKYCLKRVLQENIDDLKFFDKMYSKGLVYRLEKFVETEFGRMSYTEAVEKLQSTKKFKTVKWGDDLSSEQEKYLAREKPIFVYDYPRQIKSFYMKDNADGKTVGATDLLVPGIGELVGGSMREDNYHKLLDKMKEYQMDIDTYQWYLDLRQYGSIPHGGFGVGFERLLMLITSIDNIRDTIAFPRTTGSLSY